MASRYSSLVLDVAGFKFRLFFERAETSRQRLEEAAKRHKAGPYEIRLDPAHDEQTGKQHAHILKRGHDLFAVNFDGTAHHRVNRGMRIPNAAADVLRATFDFNIPPDNCIEETNAAQTFLLIAESDIVPLFG